MLGVLAPKYIDKLPHDIINGQPLIYRRTSEDQFVLYSVGWNQIDDGGSVGFTGEAQTVIDVRKADWVWFSNAKK
jgi:hypothetical protein